MEPNILTDAAPVTGNTALDHILTIIGALVPIFSAIAALLNNKVRAAQSNGDEVSPGMLKAIAAMNVMAVNFDKAKQLGDLAKGKPAPTTTRGVVNAAPEAGDQKPEA